MFYKRRMRIKHRYKKRAELIKSKWLKLRITEKDKAKIKQLANHTGLTTSEYLIHCALRRQLPFIDADTQYCLTQIMYELIEVGNNFNQLTKTCHLSSKLGEPVVVDNATLVKLENTLKELKQIMTKISLKNESK